MTTRLSKHLLVVGLGNYTHPNTRHSVGMMVVDAIAQRFNAGWYKKREWEADLATVQTTVTIKAPKPPKLHLDKAHRRAPAPIDTTAATDTTTSTAASSNDSAATTTSTEPSDPTTPVIKRKPQPSLVDIDVTLTLIKPTLLMNVSGTSVLKASKALGINPVDIIVIHDDMERDLGKLSFKNYGSPNGHNGIKSVIKKLSTQHFKRLRIGIGRPVTLKANRSPDVVSDHVLGKFKPLEMKTLEDIVYEIAQDEVLRMATPSQNASSIVRMN
ncbi:peptidyl-tRNA hydrolase protein 1 [Gryganskiella cystojenkinii]|nr:peptidyl-tRNA hydrolase protein 1 [Gryganskiella cystojenkinii]